jgi:selenocysteine lyase/cysteine desulfurase
VTYADYTASGRCLDFVEEFMTEKVMPTYANTHTEASATGLQTTRFVEEARETIRQCVNAGPDDVLIFTGSGSTGKSRVHCKLLTLLDLSTACRRGDCQADRVP